MGVQRSEVVCPRSHSTEIAELRFERGFVVISYTSEVGFFFLLLGNFYLFISGMRMIFSVSLEKRMVLPWTWVMRGLPIIGRRLARTALRMAVT